MVAGRWKVQTEGESVRNHPAITKNEHGVVANPLRSAIAARLELERQKREVTHKELVAMLRRGTPDGKFSYGTYVKTARQQNNITLKTLTHMAATLGITIADFLFGTEKAQAWMRKLDSDSIRRRLAIRIEVAREKHGLHRYEFAKYLGIAEATYFKIERGTANISVDTITAIAKALNLEPLELLFGR